jgi:predicted permease
MRKLGRRLQYLWNRRRLERDLHDEMQAHREMMGEDRRAAFGSSLRLREQTRDAWGWTWLDRLQQDLVYAFRQLRRAPAFTLTAVTVLALGVGLNLAVFHVVKAVFSDRVPVPDANALLRVIRQTPEREGWAFPPEAADFYRQNANLFDYLVGERLGSVAVQIGAQEGDQEALARFVTGNYFEDLGVEPALGRLLGPRDDAPGAPLVAILSNGYWRRRFAADPDVVSSTLSVNGLPVRVAGIVPTGFTGLTMSRGDLWFPMETRRRLLREPGAGALFGRPDTGLVGKLRAGVSLEAASSQLATLTDTLRTRQIDLFGDQEAVRARPLDEDDLNRAPYLVLESLVALVLLASCANLGNMLLARGLAREREIATRIAVGASRRRLIRQFLTESLLLATLGSAAGLVVGRVGARLFSMVFAGALDVQITTDLPVILAAGTLSLVSALAFGLTPALQLASQQHRATRSRQVLVAVQVATSCVLLILAGLMTRGAQRQSTLAGQADFSALIVIEPELADADLSGLAARQALEGISENLGEVPQVAAVTIATDPLYGLSVVRRPGMPTILRSSVDPNYFQIMGLRIVQGRAFEPDEQDVTVISASAAQAAFEADALGRTWNPEGGRTGPTIVGIVEPSPLAALRDAGAVEVYLPWTDEAISDASLLVRTTGLGRAVLGPVRDAASLQGLRPSVWVLQTPVDQLLEHSVAATSVIGALGATAAGLAALGIFGLMAFSVRERTREIAVRMALGARTRTIVGVLLVQYATPLAAGMSVGVLIAVAGERALIGQQMGLGLTAFDPVGYVAGMAAFTLTAVIAILVPLARAMRIDPASALHCE